MAPTAIFAFNTKEQKSHHSDPQNCLHHDHLNHHYCAIIAYQRQLMILGIFLFILKQASLDSSSFPNLIPRIDFFIYRQITFFFKPYSAFVFLFTSDCDRDCGSADRRYLLVGSVHCFALFSTFVEERKTIEYQHTSSLLSSNCVLFFPMQPKQLTVVSSTSETLLHITLPLFSCSLRPVRRSWRAERCMRLSIIHKDTKRFVSSVA